MTIKRTTYLFVLLFSSLAISFVEANEDNPDIEDCPIKWTVYGSGDPLSSTSPSSTTSDPYDPVSGTSDGQYEFESSIKDLETSDGHDYSDFSVEVTTSNGASLGSFSHAGESLSISVTLTKAQAEEGELNFKLTCSSHPEVTGREETTNVYPPDDEGDDCPSCTECENDPLSCIKFRISLGSAAYGMSKATLTYFDGVSATNKGLQNLYLNANSEFTITKDVNGDLQSVQGEWYSKISPISGSSDANAFQIELSTSASNPQGTLIKRYTFEQATFLYNGESLDALEIKEISIDNGNVLSTKLSVYAFKPAAGNDPYAAGALWIMEEGGGLRRRFLETIAITETSKQERRSIHERSSIAEAWNSSIHKISERDEYWEDFSWGKEKVKVVNDPLGDALMSTWKFYESGVNTNAPGSGDSQAGTGKLKKYARYDGYVENHFYSVNLHTIKSPFTGVLDAKVATIQYDTVANTTTKETKINGTLVVKEETSNGNVFSNKKVYTDASSYLETITEYYPATHAVSPTRVKKITYPNGTIETKEYSYPGGIKTIKTYRGSADGLQGTLTESIRNNRGQEDLVTVTAVGSGGGLVLSDKSVPTRDYLGRATKIDYFSGSPQAYSILKTYGCCGLLEGTDRSGITTYYAYDDLKRVIKTNRLGITTQTLRNGLSSSTYRYPETSATAVLSSSLFGSLTNEISRSVRTRSGKHRESWSRTAEDGSFIKSSWTDISYNPGNVLSQTSITTVPMTGSETADPTQTTETYLDGRTYQSSGNLSPHTRMSYTAGSTGMESTRSIMEGTVARESVTSKTDLAGRATLTLYADGATSSVYYNTLGQMVKSIDPDSVTSLYAYNSEGQRTITALDLNANGSIDYDTDQVSFSETNPTAAHGTTVTRTISKIWNPTDTGSTGGTVVSYSDRAVDGLSSWSTQFPNGANITTSSITTLLGGGDSTAKTISANDSYTLTTITAGLTAKSESFDSADNIISSVTYQTYDSLNRPTHIKDSRHTTAAITTYVNDVTNAVTSTTDAAGNTTSFTYDLRNRRLTTDAPDTLDAAGATLANITTTSYFSNGQTKETSGAQTYRRSYTYDYANRMKTLTTYGGTTAITEWVYDNQRGWLTEKNYAGETANGPGNTADYTYTAAGRLATRTWERDVTTTYDYDSAGRQDKITYSDSTPQVDYIYDRLSRPTFVIQGAQVAGFTVNVNEYQYNTATLALNKEIIVEGAYDSNATSSQYTSTQAFKRTLDRTQDGFLRPETLTASLNGTAEHSVAYSYDTASRLGTITHGTDTFTYGYEPNTYGLVETVTGPAHTVTNTYEANRNVLTQKENKFGTANLATASYQTNAIGQRTNATHSGSNNNGAATRAFGYNSTGEVVNSATDTAAYDRFFDFDGIGNRNESRTGTASSTGGTATSYTADAKNHYTAIGSLSPIHDADGNMTSGPLPVAPSANATLTWDAENRLASSTASGTTTNYQYDYLSRRISKGSVGVSPALTTRYVYDGWNMITEYAGSALKRSYTWGMDLSGSMQGAGGVGGLLAIHEASGNGSVKAGQTLYPTFDGNGNITRIIDSSSNVVCSYAYDPFGNFENPAGNDADSSGYDAEQPFAFSTKYRDIETGLYYYGYRYYDPVTGRWPSRDPKKEMGGTNLYQFLKNDGINKRDYLGLSDVIVFENEWHSLITVEVLGSCNCPSEDSSALVWCYDTIVGATDWVLLPFTLHDEK